MSDSLVGQLVEVTATWNEAHGYVSRGAQQGQRIRVETAERGDQAHGFGGTPSVHAYHWVTGQDPAVKGESGRRYGWIKFKVIPEATTREKMLIALLGHISKLGPKGLAVLVALGARLAKGAEEHGDFENTDRDWNQEALEEDLDGMVYRTIGLMKRAGQL